MVLPPEAVRPVAEVKARPGLDNLPYRPGHFVGRTAELDRLDAAMKESSGGVLLQAVHGLGGIGKSALAVHWAATRARTHGLTPVRWIAADSPANVEQGLAALATALQPAASKALTAEALAENGMQWLATHTGWLLILDNVNDPADIAGLLARAPGGRFLITSRLATVWHDATTIIRLDVLGPSESMALLTHIVTAGGPRDMAGAAELCAELGHLPLAVEQAAAYLAQNPLLSPRMYLDLLRRDPASMHQQGGAGVTVAERTIARIWRVTLDRIDELHHLAADLLRILAWYAPDRIPVGLLDEVAEPAAVASAIGILNAYSMVTVDPENRSLTVHRLLQSVARTPDADDPHRTPDLVEVARARATAALLAAVEPFNWQDAATWSTGRILLPHMDAIADNSPPAADTSTTARVLNHAGVFLISQGLASRAAAHLRRALGHHEQVLGLDDPDTLACRHNLANAYEEWGHLKQAIPLYERALQDEERVLGAMHPLTLATRNNLAGAYREAGDLDKALALLGQNLMQGAFSGALFGVPAAGNDLYTFMSRNHLACAQMESGNLAEAILLFEETLDACARVFGEEHHLTLQTRHNLTTARARAGNPGQAVPLFERDLDDMERVLGEDHPDTLNARRNLAHAYKAVGDLGRAIPLLERTLLDMERVHGEGHSKTRRIRMALCLAYREAGDLDRALRLSAPRQEQTDDYEPSRAGDIGYAFLAAGDPERAVPLFEQDFHDSRQKLGEDHRNTLVGRHNLAVAHLTAGDPGRAIPLFQQNLRVRERLLGEDHPDTLNTLRHLADAHREAGDLGQAIHLYDKTFRARKRTLGTDHADTLAVLNLLAYTYGLAGRPDHAIPLFEQGLQGMQRTLGADHPLTRTVREHMASAERTKRRRRPHR
ncbi:tetratricopeptide repeat protein [Streptomyces morookaense]|uniref:tetratricopeptide repeat protein n=1 Tax=Streptomyces morookaense TaxID=1970 RepID=UPI0033C293DC